ncbi:MAG: hypothetical protein JWM98_2253 [Thermoleophilia bacterium]|nr:hypothetical protein [Thermoleophilia bacterium]
MQGLRRFVGGWLCLCALALPCAARADVVVQRDAATGALRVTASDDAPAALTLGRSDTGALHVELASTNVTSPDGSCSASGEATPGRSVDCALTFGQAVQVLLGGGADLVDAREATGIALTIDAGAGADTIRAGASGTTTLVDDAAADTVDLSAATAGIRVRFEQARGRAVARCGGCATAWAVVLPRSPGRVVLGTEADDVDLAAWRARGATTWTLGDGSDRFWGAPLRRSIVMGGAGNDHLASRGVAVDLLSGGPDMDAILDLGGVGDVLRGDGGTDAISSLDGRRDTVDGGASADACISTSREFAGCDTRPGGVRAFEQAIYLPVHTLRLQLQMLGMS